MNDDRTPLSELRKEFIAAMAVMVAITIATFLVVKIAEVVH